jgi:hypothetical protein
MIGRVVKHDSVYALLEIQRYNLKNFLIIQSLYPPCVEITNDQIIVDGRKSSLESSLGVASVVRNNKVGILRLKVNVCMIPQKPRPWGVIGGHPDIIASKNYICRLKRIVELGGSISERNPYVPHNPRAKLFLDIIG